MRALTAAAGTRRATIGARRAWVTLDSSRSVAELADTTLVARGASILVHVLPRLARLWETRALGALVALRALTRAFKVGLMRRGAIVTKSALIVAASKVAGDAEGRRHPCAKRAMPFQWGT